MKRCPECRRYENQNSLSSALDGGNVFVLVSAVTRAGADAQAVCGSGRRSDMRKRLLPGIAAHGKG
ncbi:MAG TPA: hypothetical protein PKD26_12860 [Pyrinomonadaceae bacterium]|nr:hypothetical protein [Pyrinomonadaceae bacterium]